MTPWHINQTRDHVQRLHGGCQRQLVAPCLRSLVERKFYAAFHYHEAMRLLDEFKNSHLVDASLLDVVFSQEEGPRKAFNRVMIEAGAHVLACVQSLHALADILAHAVYYSLGMNLRQPALKDASISAATVLACPTWRADELKVKELFSKFAGAPDFAHIAALSNRGKHSSIVEPTLSAEDHELLFPTFVHKRARYPQVSAAALLQREFGRCSGLVVDVGNAINSTLATRTP